MKDAADIFPNSWKYPTFKYVFRTRVLTRQFNVYCFQYSLPRCTPTSGSVVLDSAIVLIQAHDVPIRPPAVIVGISTTGCIVASVERCGKCEVENSLKAGPHDDQGGSNDSDIHLDDDHDMCRDD